MAASDARGATGAEGPRFADVVRAAWGLSETRAGGLAGHVEAPPLLQGPRDVVHGGCVAAILLDAALEHAARGGSSGGGSRPDRDGAPIRVEAEFRKALPVGARLRLETAEKDDGAWRARIVRGDGALIARACVTIAGDEPAAPAASPLPAADEVPGTSFCFVCGDRNPIGLQLRLGYDARSVGKRVALPERFAAAGGTAAPGFSLAFLDEIGWWLGALRFGGCGVTNRLEATIRPRRTAGPLSGSGDRAAVEPLDARGRTFRCRAALRDAEGATVADARIDFAGSHVYTRAMAADLESASARGALDRVFPGWSGGAVGA